MVAVTDPAPATPWRRGNVQSPFVIVYEKQFCLFVTRKSPEAIDYVRTNVFCSDDIAELRAHAAEIVTDHGRQFITSAGWTKAIGEAHRGLSIAPLEWAVVPP